MPSTGSWSINSLTQAVSITGEKRPYALVSLDTTLVSSKVRGSLPFMQDTLGSSHLPLHHRGIGED